MQLQDCDSPVGIGRVELSGESSVRTSWPRVEVDRHLRRLAPSLSHSTQYRRSGIFAGVASSMRKLCICRDRLSSFGVGRNMVDRAVLK
jgi:hypothetical protein